MDEQKNINHLVADWQSLTNIFIKPEDDTCHNTLIKYMRQILFGLHDFLNKNVGITEEFALESLLKNFENTEINENPEKKLSEVITGIINNLAPHAVNVASPYFVGHMTSAIPFFMVHLKTIVAALNQNVVKLETSKVFSVVEKQVIAKIHRLIYKHSESFYKRHVQNTRTALGTFTSGGTSANLTALWVARNKVFAPTRGFRGIEEEGIAAAYEAYNVKRSVVLVSRRGHYSFRKSGGILGIGSKNIIIIDVDENNRMDLKHLRRTVERLQKEGNTRILAIVGIAGTTETGNIDPLKEIGMLCREYRVHFHVDAAWGGPTLVSEKYKQLFDGIELADSVTIDGHKQFYMPMSCGMLYFKDPTDMDVIAYYANYVNRRESVDLGKKTLAGSREANSLILDSALKVMGRRGYALLIDHGIDTAHLFAEEIEKRELLELVTPPELNILTYRVCPDHVKKELETKKEYERKQINRYLNQINKTIQRLQREAGNSFVSRTTLTNAGGHDVVVFRCVIMNPMTDMTILKKILDEQEDIYRSLR